MILHQEKWVIDFIMYANLAYLQSRYNRALFIEMCKYYIIYRIFIIFLLTVEFHMA